MLTDAFGNTVSRTGTNPTPFGFAGQWQYQADTDSGLMLLGNRYYDSEAGRFISKDPIKDGDNWYAYCGNNPLAWVDPEGRAPSEKLPLPNTGPDRLPLNPKKMPKFEENGAHRPHWDVDFKPNPDSPDPRMRGGETNWRVYPVPVVPPFWEEKYGSIGRREKREQQERDTEKKGGKKRKTSAAVVRR
jgi:RHS repeat-associated protein